MSEFTGEVSNETAETRAPEGAASATPKAPRKPTKKKPRSRAALPDVRQIEAVPRCIRKVNLHAQDAYELDAALDDAERNGVTVILSEEDNAVKGVVLDYATYSALAAGK